MSTIKELFDDCKIIIEDDKSLTINGKQIDQIYNPDSGKWVTKYLPYTEYDNLLDLAQAVIRDTVEFTHLEP